MRVSVDWLNQYLSKNLSEHKLAEVLEGIGIEIEQLIYTPKLDNRIIVGLATKVIQHPNADKLRLVNLSLGKAKIRVVCGAQNIAEGQKVPVVQVGSVLPDGTKIEAVTIRGEQSAGMIASPKELGLGDDHAGIMVLPEKTPVGKKMADLWPHDAILDVTTAANRPDLQSVIGLAREAAAAAGLKPKYVIPEASKAAGQPPAVKVVKDTKTARYMAVRLSVKPAQPTPDWMERRLNAAGIRPVGPAVDITNYVMLEYGQPLHAFDAAKVKLPISVRFAKSGEKLTTLDGQERKLTAKDLVIADKSGPIALAGIMGGAGTEISSETKEIILESATFDPAIVRKGAIRQGLRTESSARFERGLPVQLAAQAAGRAIDLIKEHAGGKLLSLPADELTVWPWVQHVGIRPSRIKSLLGVEFTRPEIANNLQKFGFEAEPFDIAAEAKKHLGKPYKWGAKFRTDGTEAFDCSYLTDYLYSLIGKWIGHTAYEQFESGRPVHTGELKPGDVLFRGGHWEKLKAEERGGISHDALYIGGGKIIHAVDYVRGEDGEWRQLPKNQQMVKIESAEVMIDDPDYKGARRYIENLEDYVAVTVPWWRPDVKTEEDLAEELIRLTGYDQVPATIPAWQPAEVRFDRWWPKVQEVKQTLVGLGLFEVMTYSFISENEMKKFGYDPAKHLKLKNPRSTEQEYLRSNLIPSLVGAAAGNARYGTEFGLFEISRVFKPKAKNELPEEPVHLGILIRRPADAYWGAKSALDALDAKFNTGLTVKSEKHPDFHPGRSGEVSAGKTRIGRIGELHPDILAKYKLTGSVAYLKLDLQNLFAAAQGPNYSPLSKFPSAHRDLSIEIKQSATWQEVKSSVEATGLADPGFLSDYYGKGVRDGHKALAFRLTMNAPDRTLTDKEADERVQKVFTKLKQKYGAELRE